MIAGLLFFVAWRWWPTDEQAIRNLLDRLVATASVQPSASGLARLAYGDRLASFFTTNATLNLEALGGDFASVHGRTELAQAALGVRTMMEEADFKVADAAVSFPGEKGLAKAYVVVTGHVKSPKLVQLNTDRFDQPFRMMLRKQEGRWRIEAMKAEEQIK